MKIRASAAGATALVTGATGAIGPELVRLLVERGYRVVVLARQPPSAGLLPEAVEVRRGDIRDPDAVRAAMHGATHVFHLAAKLHINNPDGALADEYRQTNVAGTQLVAEAALAAGVRRMVVFSTISVYDASAPGRLLDEDSPALATSLYGVTKREAEQVALAVRRPNGEPLAVVLRVAGVYGGRVKGNYRQLVRLLRRRLFVPVGPGDNRRTLVYEKDLVAAALLAAEHPTAAGRVYNVTDGRVHTFDEIVGAICAGLQRRPPRLHVPLRLARGCAGVLDAALAAFGRGRIATPLVEKLVEDMAVSGRRIQDELGFRPAFDLQRGWAETIPRIVDA